MTDFKWYEIATLFILIGLAFIGPWVLHSYQEAKVFNRVTGSDVTTWEAMWITLRVSEEGMKENRNDGGDGH